MAIKKLAIVTTHPIQYNAPLFRLLTERNRIAPKVFYTWGKSAIENKFDPGFGKTIQWDIPLLDGYEYEFLENVSTEKGSHHFKGVINPGIIGQIDAFEPDAILVFGWSFHSHLKLLRHYHKKIPILFRGDSTLLDPSSPLKAAIRRLFLKWVYGHIDFALYAGKNNRDYFKRMGLRDDQLIYAPHAIDNKRFSEESDADAIKALGIRNGLGIGKDEIVFLFAGKLEEKKDVISLLRAFTKSPLGTRLVIVGNGPLESSLKAAFEKIPSVHFMDFQNQSQMPVIYRVGDVFVLPSKGPGETWGLAVNEAMASGRAILVSDRCGGAVDLVENGKNGYLFKSEDISDLVSKMDLLVNAGKAGIREMGAYSAHKIESFSFEAVCVAIENNLHNNIRKTA
jgi:glycosyltransferase involved in cell wall biosynthesis